MTVPLPDLLPVRGLLEDLLGREVLVRPGQPTEAGDLPGTSVALYVDNSTRLAAVLGLDLPLAAHAGAALGLMPAGVAAAAVAGGALSPELAENVGELCNVLARLLNREGAPHVTLYRFHPPGEPAPADAAAYLLALGHRIDVDVTIARYGRGRLALALAH